MKAKSSRKYEQGDMMIYFIHGSRKLKTQLTKEIADCVLNFNTFKGRL
jgi:hypothetical protein